MININQKAGGGVVTYGSYIVQNGLILNLDAANPNSYALGLTAIDLSGYNNNGSLVNLVDYTTSNKGALVLNGANSYINVTDTTLNTFSGSITICAWINTLTASAEQGIIWKGTIGNPDWGIELYQSKFNYQVGSSFKQASTVLSNNTWYNVCVSHPQGGTGSLYINGSFVTNDNGSIQDPLNIQTPIKIGINATSYYFSGYIPIMQVYNRALSATEVMQNYMATRARFNVANTDIVRNGLVLYLDAAKSISYSGTGLTASDITGNNNNGSLLNYVDYTTSNNGALVLNGSSSIISIGTKNLIQNDFTLSIWYKLNSNAIKEHFLFSTGYISPSSFLLTSDDQGNGNATLAAYYVSSGGVNTSYFLSSSLSSSQLYNITLVRNGIVNTPYINGVTQATFTNSTVLGSGLYELGYATQRNKTTSYMQGNIYTTQIYNRALSATEVMQNYMATRGRYSTPNTDIVRNGLVLYLDAAKSISYSGTGLTASDITGNNNNGSLVNGVGYTSSYSGAFVMDGINDYIRVQSMENTNFPQLEGTIGFWYYINSLTGSTDYTSSLGIFDGYDAARNHFFIRNYSTIPTNIQIAVQDSTTASYLYSYNGSASNDNWHNIVLTYKTGTSSSVKFYIDSVLKASGVLTSTAWTPTNQAVGFCNGSSSLCMKGNYSNLLIYNRQITATEILQNYNAMKGRYGL